MSISEKSKKYVGKLHNDLELLGFSFENMNKFCFKNSNLLSNHTQETRISNLIAMVNVIEFRFFVIEWLINKYDISLLKNFNMENFQDFFSSNNDEFISQQKKILSILGVFKLGSKECKVGYTKILRGTAPLEFILSFLVNLADITIIKKHYDSEISVANTASTFNEEIDFMTEVMKNKGNLFKKQKQFKWNFEVDQNANDQSSEDEQAYDIEDEYNIKKRFHELVDEIKERQLNQKHNQIHEQTQENTNPNIKSFSELKELLKNQSNMNQQTIENFSRALKKITESIEHFNLITGQCNFQTVIRRKEIENYNRKTFGEEQSQKVLEFDDFIQKDLVHRKVLKDKLIKENDCLRKIDWKVNQKANEELGVGEFQSIPVQKNAQKSNLKNNKGITDKNIYETIEKLQLDFGYNIGKEF